MYENVTYASHGLEKLLATRFSGERATGDLFEVAQHPDHIKAVIARLSNEFVQRTFAFEDEGSLERYVRFYERMLIRICDEWYNKARSSLAVPGCKDIEYLLSYIESLFPNYFDYDAKPPLSYIVSLQTEVKDWLQRLEPAFKTQQVDLRGLEIALFPLKRFVSEATNSEITYRSLEYVKEVGKQLDGLVDVCKVGAAVNGALRELLYYLNFNFRQSIEYMIDEIKSAIDDLSSIDVRIERLAFMQKQLAQSVVKTGIGFNVHATSLKDEVSRYLAAEMDYALHLQRSGLENRGDDESAFRLKLNMSVSQTACLLKMMSDAGLIQNANAAALIRFVSNHCETKRAGRVSAGSFRTKFYNIEAATMASVREILERLKNGTSIS